MSELRVITPGMLTTVQDLGRWGFQSRGVSVAGPMDVYSHRLANALVGNPVGMATLEVTLIGPELEFTDERLVAVTGAAFELTVAGEPGMMDTTFVVQPGCRLQFGRRAAGARAYLAIEGGIGVAPVLGSRSTHLGSALGGIDGRALKVGDRLPLGLPKGPAKAGPHVLKTGAGREGRRRVQLADLPDGHRQLRVMPGPQLDYFSDHALGALQSAPYTIDSKSDRMAFRLVGEPLPFEHITEMISDVTPMGTLQVPPSGMPILLMADRQTIGGYPQIATVISADLPVAGQLAPGDQVWFIVCSRAEAMAALIARERTLVDIES